MKHNLKGFTPILILAAVAAVAIFGYFLIRKGVNPAIIPTTNQSEIQNDGDLNKAASDLDDTDINEVNTGLNQLNSDASTF